ncbi:MAG: hypothetical protein ACLP2Y_06370 [Limisphaerales bacterium]
MAEPTIPTHALEQLLEMLREARTRADERANHSNSTKGGVAPVW